MAFLLIMHPRPYAWPASPIATRPRMPSSRSRGRHPDNLDSAQSRLLWVLEHALTQPRGRYLLPMQRPVANESTQPLTNCGCRLAIVQPGGSAALARRSSVASPNCRLADSTRGMPRLRLGLGLGLELASPLPQGEARNVSLRSATRAVYCGPSDGETGLELRQMRAACAHPQLSFDRLCMCRTSHKISIARWSRYAAWCMGDQYPGKRVSRSIPRRLVTAAC